MILNEKKKKIKQLKDEIEGLNIDISGTQEHEKNEDTNDGQLIRIKKKINKVRFLKILHIQTCN